jgi:hypothetical protein
MYAADAEGDRREVRRFSVSGSAALHSSTFSTPIWGTLRDISSGGCYVQCVNVAAEGTVVSGQFVLNGVQINAVTEVCTSRINVGMGLRWCDLGWDGEEKLKAVLRTLAASHTEANAGKAKALAQLDKLHQLLTVLRERVENNTMLVDDQMIARLSDAQERLAAALKGVQT